LAVVVASPAHADIFQWEYINPADPSQGKRQSTTLAPDGAGVDAVPGAFVRERNLTMAYLIGANLTNADFDFSTLTNADFTNSIVRGASFSKNNVSTGISLTQLYSTASYEARDLTGMRLNGNDLVGGNFALQDLSYASFQQAQLAGVKLRAANLTGANFGDTSLTDVDFTDAEVRQAIFRRNPNPVGGGGGITLEQLYSTASYRSKDLSGVNFVANNLAGGDFTGQKLTNAAFLDADLAGAIFRFANLSNADFSNHTTLVDADFREANLSNAAFHNAALSNADFTGAEVRRTDFSQSAITPAQLYSTASYLARDLTGILLGGTNLTGGNFASQNLYNANLIGATLTGADFTGADVRGALFSSTSVSSNIGGFSAAQLYSTASYQARDLTGILLIGDLNEWNFTGQNLTGAYLSLASLSGADFSEANLTGADLLGATLTGAEFRESNLTGAVFQTATLAAADLRGAILTGADFRDASLTDADFSEADVRGAVLGSTTSRGFAAEQLYSTASYRAHDLTGIHLAGNDLSAWNFAGQVLSGANFQAAVLTGADFSASNITDARFALANLTGANFRNSNLANAVFSVRICLHGCIKLYATLTDADLTSADARGAIDLNLSDTATTNLIRPDGHIHGLDLEVDGLLVVRDYDGNPNTTLAPEPIPITIDQHMAMGPGSTLRMVFEADAWDSTISFAPGIPVTFGGTLELTFADDVNLASQVGRTFDLFDWTGVTATGAFTVSSSYSWDLSNLYTSGEVTLTAVPEPSVSALATSAVFSLTLCRRRTLS
jgi:uncharacterized protein YjbI with pentapeptide repeats